MTAISGLILRKEILQKGPKNTSQVIDLHEIKIKIKI